MLTAIAALVIASLVGGVFGSVATYTYVDSSDGKYCDRMGSVEIEETNENNTEDTADTQQPKNEEN
jgi:hypothetical protein